MRRRMNAIGRWGALGAAVVMLLTGCTATVGPGYVGEPYPSYDPYPYDYGPTYGGVYIEGGYPYSHRHYVHEYSHRGFEYHHGIDSPHAWSRGGRNVGGHRGVVGGRGHGSSDHR
jgi:hypothetical protein